MTESKSLGHLTELGVDGLFGSRSFSFRLDLKEPTLLTGTNGSGKSTVLRILNSIGTGDWRAALRLPFDAVSLSFEHGTRFTLDRISSSRAKVTIDGVEYSLDLELFDHSSFDDASDDELASLMPEIALYGAGYFEFRGRLVAREELIKRLSGRGPVRLGEEHAGLADFIKRFHLLFITDQRLVVTEDRYRNLRGRTTSVPNPTAAEASARELGRQMQQALSAYASESQRLDRDFPHRVVEAMASDDEVPIERLTRLLEVVEDEQIALQRVGLLPRDLRTEAFRGLPLEERNVRPVIETFIQDTRQKFAVLADLRERLTLFVDYLNQHFENKRVIAQTRTGFRVEIDGNPDQVVEPSQLSSGEQQILVLAYEILFRSEPDTLVLIDEPELSLHVLWQDTFIEDLSRMGNARNLQFVLATHSPSLIGGRDDLKRSLDIR